MKRTRLVLVLVLFVLLLSFVPTEVTAQNSSTCAQNSDVQAILYDVTQGNITQWIRNFSGEDYVKISGVERKILTRHSAQMFTLNVNAMAYPYLGEQLVSFGYEQGFSLVDHSYNPYKNNSQTQDTSIGGASTEVAINLSTPEAPAISELDQATTWKNKVVTIPGHGPNADEIVLMTAHLDSTSTNPTTLAPGAEDNASGVSALMEAARLFRFYKFDRTIKIIFFTGEEQGLYGSEAYVDDHSDEMDDIVGVINLDMFGYDADNDGCFELHVGTRTDSNVVGSCFTDVITNYNLNLTYDYITTGAIPYSDHASFWAAQVGAIEVLENSYTHTGLGCGGIVDDNPYYHTINDKITHMNLPVTLSIAQGGIGTTASLALPIGKCFATDPQISATPQSNSILLTWPEVVDADVYDVYRSSTTCGGTFTQVAQVTTNSFEDTDIEFNKYYFYKVQAAETGAVCYSQLSNCAVTKVEEPVFFHIFVPLVIAVE